MAVPYMNWVLEFLVQPLMNRNVNSFVFSMLFSLQKNKWWLSKVVLESEHTEDGDRSARALEPGDEFSASKPVLWIKSPSIACSGRVWSSFQELSDDALKENPLQKN